MFCSMRGSTRSLTGAAKSASFDGSGSHNVVAFVPKKRERRTLRNQDKILDRLPHQVLSQITTLQLAENNYRTLQQSIKAGESRIKIC